MSPRHSLLGTLAGAALALAALGLVACGTTDSGGNPGGNTDGGTKKDSGWTWDYGDASVYIPDGGELCPDCEQDAGACAANTTKAKELPLDIYIMLDQSSSMSDVAGTSTKWDTVASAPQTFLSQPLVDVSVGIQFFGLPIDAAGDDSCTASDYATPSVEIAPLPGVFNAIKSAVQAHGPSTATPTAPALQGAINHAKSWGGFHPQHVTIVIFATDGDPTECSPQDIPSIQQIAAAGVAGTPKILTFVIGVGSSLSNLNAIASSGGTTQAFLADTSSSTMQSDLVQALNQIRGAALGCSYQIPDPGDAGVIDFTQVNVQYTPGSGGPAQAIPQAPDQASCPPNADAWYYDNATAPTKILLCPYTCNRITPDSSGQVDILTGCKTQVIG